MAAVAAVGAALTTMVALTGVMLVGLPMAIFGAVLAVGALITAFAGLGAAMAIGYSLWSIFKTNMAGSMDSWEKVTTVISAVYETLQNWNSYAAMVSDETADKLESMGLTDVFHRIMTFVRDAKFFFGDLWKGFTAGIDSATEPLKNSLLATLEKLSILLFSVLGIFDDGSQSIGEMTSAGEELGHTLARALDGAIGLAKRFVDHLGYMAEHGEETALGITGITDAFFDTLITVSKLLAVVVQVGAAVASLMLMLNNVYSVAHFLVSSLMTAGKLLAIMSGGGDEIYGADKRVGPQGKLWGAMTKGEKASYVINEHGKTVDDDRARSLQLRGAADTMDGMSKGLWNAESLEEQKKAWHESVLAKGRSVENSYKNGHRRQTPMPVDNSWIGGPMVDDMWGDLAKAGPRELSGQGPRLPLSVTAPPGSSTVSSMEMDPGVAKYYAQQAAAAAAEYAEAGGPNMTSSAGPSTQPINMTSSINLDGEQIGTMLTPILVPKLTEAFKEQKRRGGAH